MGAGSVGRGGDREKPGSIISDQLGGVMKSFRRLMRDYLHPADARPVPVRSIEPGSDGYVRPEEQVKPGLLTEEKARADRVTYDCRCHGATDQVSSDAQFLEKG